MDKVFFTNSGTEAIEGALKIAKSATTITSSMKPWGRPTAARTRAGHDREIIAMDHSFHGRSLGALSVTGNAHYQEPFKPLIPGIRFADFNDLDSVKGLINRRPARLSWRPSRAREVSILQRRNSKRGPGLCDEHGPAPSG